MRPLPSMPVGAVVDNLKGIFVETSQATYCFFVTVIGAEVELP
jgi:hypothetical protein